MPLPDPADLQVGFTVLSADGVDIATFSELNSLTSSIEVPDAGEPSKRDPRKKLPGKRIPPTVVLKRGLTSSLDLWDWHQAAVAGEPTGRKTCDLIMFTTDGRPVARYHLEMAWPAKVELTSGAAAPGTVIESVTLVADQLQRVRPF